MANSSFLLRYLTNRRRFLPLKPFLFLLPTTLALISICIILLNLFTTRTLFTQQQDQSPTLYLNLNLPFRNVSSSHINVTLYPSSEKRFVEKESGGERQNESQLFGTPQLGSKGTNFYDEDVFHDREIFLEEFREMNRSFKIYVYPHRKNEPFARNLLPVDYEPGGNYASESFFQKALMNSHFITKDPMKANLFFLPFSIARLRHDPQIGGTKIPDFVRDYIFQISQNYPFWNRTGGADHFYSACHSIGRTAMKKATIVKDNAIQVVCSSSYFIPGHIAHKDVSLPQIWPRKGDPDNLVWSKRKKLAFFAGAANSPVREKLVKLWRNDSEIFAHAGRLKTPYADELLGSKFCIHAKGFEVNTARIADALYYGCVPVIIANYYDLPFADILNWKSFSVVVTTSDIPKLKKILKRISSDEYTKLRLNVLKVREHFQWHSSPVGYDTFYMVMYELWLRRTSVRIL
ncbi:hypothetical protein ACFE04_000974 [Oxalis oulophora]